LEEINGDFPKGDFGSTWLFFVQLPVQPVTHALSKMTGKNRTPHPPLSIIRRQGFRHHISIRAPKYPLATLIQRIAAAVLHHFLEQAPDFPYPVHQNVKFCEFSLRQLLPAL
jgi:hypothetical protein